MRQTNAVREGLRSGDVQFGANVETGSPRLVEIYGDLGLDWVWIDLEHKNPAGFDTDWLEHRVRAAEAAGTELLVRVPTGEPALVRKVLDAGVRNVLIPRVRTVEEVTRAVRAGRFAFDGGPGRRGLGKGRSSSYGSAYAPGQDDYVGREDENTMVGVLVENQEAVENIEDITAVPELGFVLPGFGDLSVSLEQTLEYDDPAVTDAIERVEAACAADDVPMLGVLGGHFSDVASAREAAADGYRLLGLGHDFAAVREVLGGRLAEFGGAFEDQ